MVKILEKSLVFHVSTSGRERKKSATEIHPENLTSLAVIASREIRFPEPNPLKFY